MKATLFGMLLLGMVACRSTPQSVPSQPRISKGCERLIKMSQRCYDESNADVSCAEMHSRADAAGEAANMSADEQDVFSKFCEFMCQLRKEGAPWPYVRQAVQDKFCR